VDYYIKFLWGGLCADDLGRYRKYNGVLVRDLLRVIRNKSHHHRDLASEVRAALGELPGTLRPQGEEVLEEVTLATPKDRS
jgi:hypothetical protein